MGRQRHWSCGGPASATQPPTSTRFMVITLDSKNQPKAGLVPTLLPPNPSRRLMIPVPPSQPESRAPADQSPITIYNYGERCTPGLVKCMLKDYADGKRQISSPTEPMRRRPCPAMPSGGHKWKRFMPDAATEINLRLIGVEAVAFCRACGGVRSKHEGRPKLAYWWSTTQWCSWLKPEFDLDVE